MSDRDLIYDRQLLLHGPKRNAALELTEVQRYGIDSYGDGDYVSIYGMRPAEWYAKGIRVLGRTAVECTRDALGNAIGKDIAEIAMCATDSAGMLVIDPFVGSANTLYRILRHLPHARGLGFELDRTVFQLTKQNLATLAVCMDIFNVDYMSGLVHASVKPDPLLIAFIAPPWGDALSRNSGLDPGRTKPPVPGIIEFLVDTFQNRLLCGIQVYETVNRESLMDVKSRFDWSSMRMYRLNAPGQNHGILLGTKRWRP